MDRMRTRFIIAVTERLASAAESGAKVELVEELSENLFSRWQDLVSNGMDEEEAYRQALDELGDVDELLAYLASLGPDGELPKRDASFKDFTSDLLHGVEGIVRETMNQTRDAVDQATVIVRNVADKIKEKYPEGFKGRVYVHFDGDDAHADRQEPECTVNVETPECTVNVEPPEAPEPPEPPEAPEAPETPKGGWSFSVGYNRDRGGFFCESGRTASSRRVSGTNFPSQDLRSVDVQLVNGDVTINLDENPEADVRLEGDAELLEVRVSDEGCLSIRQGNTASSSFFFHRGLAKADVDLTLPKRFWDSLQISATNGDIDIEEGLEARRLAVKTASGDATIGELTCTELSFKSASGDIDGSGVIGSVQAETASGDIQLEGAIGAVRAVTASGDVDLTGSVREIRCSSASGDISVETEVMPEQLEVSSKSGDCDVSMPGGQGFTLHFSTVSGDLDTDFPLVGPVGSRSGDAMYLDGGGRTFRVTSISGDITLRQM